MPTVNHVRRTLYIGNTTGFRGFWEFTKTMRKAGWKYKASSDGTAKETTGDPALDKWGATGQATTNAGAAAASIATPTRGRATVTGLTGIVAADKGRFLVITGGATAANNHFHQIEEIISSTSVRIDARNFAVAADASNGSLTWSIYDPLGEQFSAYTAPNAIGWWVGQGPSVLKIPITAASTGAFKRGENIVQASTGAEGELVGYTYYNAVGWLVVAPRLRGTGTGAHGWDTGNLITGSKSGATVTQVGTAIDYVHEICIIKPANQTQIQIFFIQVDKAAESAELFSTLATAAGCTATVHPGGGGTGNAFPTHAWVAYGTNSTPGTAVNIINVTGNIAVAGLIVCVDAIPEQNYSADGSIALNFSAYYNNVASNQQSGGPLYGLQRLNDTEDGEISLYVSCAQFGTKALNTPNRLSSGTALNITTMNMLSFYFMDALAPGSNYAGPFAGWRGRSLSGEAFTEFMVLAAKLSQSSFYPQRDAAVWAQVMLASANPLIRPREKIWLTSYGNARMYKGSLRWLYWVNGGFLFDVYGGDPGWVQIAYPGQDTPNNWGGGAMVLGPHDGSPVSIQPVL